MDEIQKLQEAVYRGDAENVVELTISALDAGVAPEVLLKEGLIAGMNIVGVDFKCGDLFVPEVLVAARAMKDGLDILRPHLVAADVRLEGKIVIGTVYGDLHDIGKNLVAMMFEGAGYEVIDLGTNVASEQFVDAVVKHQPDVLGMSALLTTTMPMMGATIKALEEAGLRDRIRVLVGGAPVTSDYAGQIGADGYAPDAANAVDLAKSLKRMQPAAGR